MGRSKCKYCGEDILWIGLAEGKRVPCNVVPDYFEADPHGEAVFITIDGRVGTGRAVEYAERDPAKHQLAYVPHLATCTGRRL